MKPRRYFVRNRHAAARTAGASLLIFWCFGGVQPASGGDILRGGGSSPAAAPTTSVSGNGTPPPVVANAAKANDSLARATQAIQAVQAMQLAARNLANGGPNNAGNNPNRPGTTLPDVPDGLGSGGLQVDPRVPVDTSLWTGAELPAQTTGTGGKVTVTIKQTAQQALLNWETFNVGKNTALKFDQSAGGSNVGQWIAFNKVNDPSGNPTQILGTIDAPGQVYVINRNGIIFGGSSQVNTHTLVASSLPINDNLIERGLLNNPDQQFLFSALKLAAGANGTPAFDPGVSPDTKLGDVIVQAGAKLTAPTSAEKIGGRIALVGPNVTNEGTISTPDGQTILAAGLQVGFSAHATSDPSLRGLDVYIGAVVDPSSTLEAYAGTATNRGIIEIARASATLAGKTVNQQGVIWGTTSVSLNGRIDLLANYEAIGNTAYDPNSTTSSSPFLNRSTGTVTLGEGSVTQITPELDSKEKVVGTQLALRSQINVQGNVIHFAKNSLLHAPNAVVTVSAGVWDYVSFSSTQQQSNFLRSGGQIYLDKGATIDVSGSRDVQSSVASNIVEVQLRGTELADSPLIRDGALRGETIYVDINATGTYNGKAWVGTPLADVSGYVGLVQRTVGELTTAGGTVKLDAGGSVVIRDGATVDVSGGSVNYAGGVVQTTRLVSGGKVYEIEKATPDRVYDGIYGGSVTKTNPKWQITQKYLNPIPINGTRYDAGYTQGGSGGSLEIAASSMALDGALKGSTIQGVRQRVNLPQAASLKLSFTSQEKFGTNVIEVSPNAPTVTFRNGVLQSAVADFALQPDGTAAPLDPSRVQDVVLSPDALKSGGFGSLSVYNPDGDIVVPEGVELSLSPGGSVTLSGANIEIGGSVKATGGTLTFNVFNISPSVAAILKLGTDSQTPAAEEGRGMFTLGSHGVLSTAGGIVDDRPSNPASGTGTVAIKGGTISITGYSAEFAEGGVVDVSGGVRVDEKGKATYGNAGAIAIATGQDTNIVSVLGGTLSLGSEFRGYSGAAAGSLSLQASRIRIGGAAEEGVLTLDSGFFNQGGFGKFSLTGLGAAGSEAGTYLPAVEVAPGAVVAPQVMGWLATADFGSAGGISLVPILMPEGLRKPVSLSLTAKGVKDQFNQALLVRGDVVVSEGGTLQAGPGGSVSLKGDTVGVYGSVLAAGGSISINGSGSLPSTNPDPTEPFTTVDIGSHAVISAAGATVLTPDAYGRKRGYVLAGGSIRIAGNILARDGAVLDVSGASDTLDLARGDTGLLPAVGEGTSSKPGGIATVSTRVDSDAGSISLEGGQQLFTEATLLGKAGGPTALGGTLSVSSGHFSRSGVLVTPLDVDLEVTQDRSMVLGDSGASGIGGRVTDADGNALSGLGHFAVRDFADGGFDNLTLSGTVRFKGDVSVQAKGAIRVASDGVMFADSKLNLSASYVSLGTAFAAPLQPGQQQSVFLSNGQPYYVAPTHGTGELTVSGGLIDVGNLVLQGIGKASLLADGGDIRGNGSFDLAGDLYLRAGQIYPPTATTFTIAAHDYMAGGTQQKGSITVAAFGSRRLPLSAGGKLNLYASTITQGGTLRAPFGTINLGWNGTGTAPKDLFTGGNVPVTQTLTLAAGSITSVSAIDPATGKGITIPYGVSLDGKTWIDPTGVDITNSGPPEKAIHLSGESVTTEEGSTVDLRGGGDLYGYRWVKGLGGTVDILASTTTYAVLPGYEANYAPFAPFNDTAAASGTLGSDPGYVNGTLKVGDQVRLAGGGGLAAGVYTLLPARYALLPGAYLVSVQNGTPTGTVAQPDGSTVVTGYRFNSLNESRTLPELAVRFEIASSKTVRKRAEYTDLLATKFFTSEGVGRLPFDSGQLVLAATRAMAIQGGVASQAAAGGRGGLIDISSPVDIVIGGPGTTVAAGSLLLDSDQLSAFGAESLLIGGVRSSTADGTTVTVTTGNLTVDNAGTSLKGPDIILAAKGHLTLEEGSKIEQAGKLAGSAENLHLGSIAVAGSGNGTLVRVSSDTTAVVTRAGTSGSLLPVLDVGAGAVLSGGSVILDSTSLTRLDDTAVLTSEALSLHSGRISLVLDGAGTLPADAGLVLTGQAMAGLQSAHSLSLLSYSSLDLYGTGAVGGVDAQGRPLVGSLALQAGSIRGFDNAGGTVTFNAKDILLGNNGSGTAVAGSGALSGNLVFNAETIRFGNQALVVDSFADVSLAASRNVLVQGSGSFHTKGSLTVTTPYLTSAKTTDYGIVSEGALSLVAPASTGGAQVAGGLGAKLSLTGTRVTANSGILLPSGSVTLKATSGDVTIGGSIDTGGVAQRFQDVTKYTDGGTIRLVADQGNVVLAQEGTLSVAAKPGGGDAGTLSVSAIHGGVNFLGKALGQGGNGGDGGGFSLDTGSLAALGDLNAFLNASAFTASRDIRVRTGDVLVDGLATASEFNLSADQGSIRVTGTIDASGVNGGSISLSASGSVTLASGALLDASGAKFDNAGKGGSVTLETRGANGGVVDIVTGSAIDLAVDEKTADSVNSGRFSGTLHLRAPQISNNTEVAVNAIGGTITDASSIIVEGYRVYDLTASGGVISTTVQNDVKNQAASFMTNADAITNRLLAGQGGTSGAIGRYFTVRPGAEIVNTTGDLTLGTTSSTATSDWNLASYRFGSQAVPGILRLKAKGNLVFNNALSDGFTSAAYTSTLLAQNAGLALNAQSWSYRLVSGADFGSADYRRVLGLDQLATDKGSLQLGKNGGILTATGGANATTASVINPTGRPGLYQVIRTGSGDIDIHSGRDVQLLNQFAAIYTAGTQVADPTMGGTFVLPNTRIQANTFGSLGAIQQTTPYIAQYTLGGGNVTIEAQGDILRLTRDRQGNLIADSEHQLPINWLYRRGYVDPVTGEFGLTRNGDAASTTWWVDFSNFFEGVGTLGGGNVTLKAGRDIANVDAVAATNARMPSGKPDATKLVELGGGDVTVIAGRNIDAGVYYVERGQGTLEAGGSIVTNSTRSPSLGTLTIPSDIRSSSSWLPTTLFLGKGGFEVNAFGDLLLGPVANPFLLPQGYNNSFWNKTYFSTYSADSSVKVESLAGTVTLRESSSLATAGSVGSEYPILLSWFQNVLQLNTSPQSVSLLHPWLRLAESNSAEFTTGATLMPGTLSVTAFSSDINLVGNLTLSPSAKGSIDLLAAGSISGLQTIGSSTLNGLPVSVWASSTINLSDADPNSIPGIANPFAFQRVIGTAPAANRTGTDFLVFLDNLFNESGRADQVLQTKQALHAAGLLHLNDTQPVRLYADGDISGLTLFSGKFARVMAGRDIADISLYLQHVSSGNTSVVSSGRDIALYSTNTAAGTTARSTGNSYAFGESEQAGDIQISGPGTLEVFAGRNLDLGLGSNRADGTGVGITSIGNGRNPYLPFEGADIIAGAGIGLAGSLAGSSLDFPAFIEKFVKGPDGPEYLKELKLDAAAFDLLSEEDQRAVALQVFYFVLRDTGRDHNDPDSPGYGLYDKGKEAIATLFPGEAWNGSINTQARDIRTRSGGDISLFAPGGGLEMASTVIGNPLAPPGIITEAGGKVSIFTHTDISLGIARIFTLRGGDEILWSSIGDIAAGSSSKTVQSAPPTRVLIDPQSGDVKTDLAGLATGGGIGVLTTVAGVEPSDVDLIAPEGTIDAGDAGIRVSGNLNYAAAVIVNAGNIAAGGTTTGSSTGAVSGPAVGAITAASNVAGASTTAAVDNAPNPNKDGQTMEETPSIIEVEVLGYGGGDDAAAQEEDEEKKRSEDSQETSTPGQ